MYYEEMKRRLEPEMILCNGRIPDEIAGEVRPMEKGYTVRVGKEGIIAAALSIRSQSRIEQITG